LSGLPSTSSLTPAALCCRNSDGHLYWFCLYDDETAILTAELNFYHFVIIFALKLGKVDCIAKIDCLVSHAENPTIEEA